MNTYILQKDLPDIKAGAIGEVNENGLLCFYENQSLGTPEYFFPKGTYENKSEWFKQKENISVIRVCYHHKYQDDSHGYQFITNGIIPDHKFDPLRRVIEFIINDDDQVTYSTVAEKFKARFGIGERLRTYKINFEEIDEFFNSLSK